MADFYVLSGSGELHRMEAGDAGSNAGAPFEASLISDLGRYSLCRRAKCFPESEAAAEPEKAHATAVAVEKTKKEV
jgi:hypothetical protein